MLEYNFGLAWDIAVAFMRVRGRSNVDYALFVPHAHESVIVSILVLHT